LAATEWATLSCGTWIEACIDVVGQTPVCAGVAAGATEGTGPPAGTETFPGGGATAVVGNPEADPADPVEVPLAQLYDRMAGCCGVVDVAPGCAGAVQPTSPGFGLSGLAGAEGSVSAATFTLAFGTSAGARWPAGKTSAALAVTDSKPETESMES
jgi:hypothetical protein